MFSKLRGCLLTVVDDPKAFTVVTLIFCSICALILPVDPFPIDGWFRSQDWIFKQHPPHTDNLRPITAPAYLYFFVDRLVNAAGGGVKEEFYVGSLFHHAMLFASGLFLFGCGRCLSLGRAGGFWPLIMVVYLETTMLPQSFWSENTAILLIGATLFIAVRIYATTEVTWGLVLKYTIPLGIVLGLATTTRHIPILLLPGLILMVAISLPKRWAWLASGVTIVSLTLILLASMAANQYRFGRFEFTNVQGQHLWVGVQLLDESFLATSREYQHLKVAIPDVKTRPRWKWSRDDFQHVPEIASYTKNDLLKKISFHVIRTFPKPYLLKGIHKTRRLLSIGDSTIGLHGKPGRYNLLGRTDFLPAIIGGCEFTPRLFRRIGEVGAFYIYPLVVLISLCICTSATLGAVFARMGLLGDTRTVQPFNTIQGLAVLLLFQAVLWSIGWFMFIIPDVMVEWFRFIVPSVLAPCSILVLVYPFISRRTAQEHAVALRHVLVDKARLVVLSGILTISFFGCLLVSWTIEAPLARYSITYIPILSLMAAIATHFLLVFLKHDGQPPK